MGKLRIIVITFAALLAMVVSAYAIENGSSSTSSSLVGDIDNNGIIDSKDALLVLEYAAHLSEEINMQAADITNDGAISTRDALTILKIAAGLIDDPTPGPTQMITQIPTEAPTAIPTPIPTPVIDICPEKPVIYLYPEEEMEVSVKLKFNGEVTSTYPSYDEGWNVIAKPDGTLYDTITNREYYCLFWEGIAYHEYDFSKGFVVPGNETMEFLEWSLEELGLNEKEANEFIIYWLPRMEHNKYNLISFQFDTYTDNAKLDINPTPDSVLRVFLAFKEIDEPIDIEAQELEPFERTGFTVVEWGGAECQ